MMTLAGFCQVAVVRAESCKWGKFGKDSALSAGE